MSGRLWDKVWGRPLKPISDGCWTAAAAVAAAAANTDGEIPPMIEYGWKTIDPEESRAMCSAARQTTQTGQDWGLGWNHADD